LPIVRVLSFRDFSSVNCTIWRYHKYLKVVKSFKKLHCSLCCIKTSIIYERCLEYKIEIVLTVSVSSKQCQRALSLTVPLFWSSFLSADFNIKLSRFTLGGKRCAIFMPFFLQTMSIKCDSESVVTHRPVYSVKDKCSRTLLWLLRNTWLA